MKNTTKTGKGKKVIGIILLSILIILIIAVSIYCYRCLHYWQSDLKKTLKAGFEEKQVVLPDGSVINYAEGPDNGNALLLIHGQTGAWDDYTSVLPELSKNWHVFALDCYGHGKSTHDVSKYYLKENGDDFIWFIEQVIGEKTVVSGHSSGGLLAAYVAAYDTNYVVGAVLEDPPVFSTEKDYFEKSFAYHDTYKNMHDYISNEQTECWEAYYMRNCLWGQLYMASSMDGLANYAKQYREKHPGKPVQYFFMPESINFTFLHTQDYDFLFGEHFYDYTWHNNIPHKTLMSDIKVPTIFIHAKDSYTEDGILQAASSDEQAREAVSLIKNCELAELTSNHDIHRFNSRFFIDTINSLEASE